ncbi:hypothetical protein [Ureibacillus sinduriensis]|uniref:Uncharacterized protein n=1 Tax=Ureibacillus sinduriensis BLB-1 = JCM 15800 TaxID=1384057 RepID=A0A0A3IJ28_9BACL|nr:hypothetical protein [Ureibacillus sinduriensis]KGR74862.1 hypothetical protein CD33_13920 [Ureibacillus sinduriensis BLB-1 = JCM 15800]
MELHTLQQSLRDELTKKSNASILQSDTWCVPVHSLNVTYKPVIRTKMDILMKMLFLSLKDTKFESAEQISEILLVEQLFVEDLLSKMQKTGLIEKVDFYFQLTEKGQRQFASGIFEEEQNETSTELLYSPTHTSFLYGDIEEVLEFEDFPEQIFRYQVQGMDLSFEDSVIIAEIQGRKEDNEEIVDEQGQLFITSIDSLEDVQVNDVPCIEYLLYDEEKDLFTVRVWNTLINKWDDQLEQLIQEYERTTWRDKLASEA